MKHCLAVFCLGVASIAFADPVTSSPPTLDATCLDTWWPQARAHLAEQAYNIVEAENVPTAFNHSQGYRAGFGDDAVTLRGGLSGEAAWTWQWETTGIGREGALESPAGADLISQGKRMTYRRGTVDEWYVNRDGGIEQGFTLAAAPAGDGPIVVEARVTGGTPVLLAGGRAIRFEDTAGRTFLHYEKLVTRDATGRVLPSRMELSDAHVRLVVDDTAAEYPIEIDPVLTNPIWEAKSDIQSSFFGHVDHIGDVNNDGYDDIGVGASQYPPNGKHFVYLNKFKISGQAQFSAVYDWDADGQDQLERFGESAAGGDFNGDGFQDLALGAYMSDRVDVYYGSDTGLSEMPQHLFGPKGSEFGMSLDALPMYNILGVGAPGMTIDEVARTGGAYLYYGGGDEMEPLSDQNVVPLLAPDLGIEFGFDLKFGWFIKDQDDDGEVDVDDGWGQIIVGSPAATYDPDEGEDEAFAGRAHVFSIGLRYEFKGQEPQVIWDYTYPAGETYFGREIAVGNFNGEACDSVAFGLPDLDDPDTNQENQGGVVVFLNDGLNLSKEPDQTLWSVTPQVGFGIDLASGYFDDDNRTFKDLVVGVPFSNEQMGHADVYLGGGDGLEPDPDCYAMGTADNGLFGLKVGNIGWIDDSNREGFAVGALFEGDLTSGAAYGYQLPDDVRVGCLGDPDAAPGCCTHELPFKDGSIQPLNAATLPWGDLTTYFAVVLACTIAALIRRRQARS